MRDNDQKQKNVLIIGGTSGIGFAAAQKLSETYNVIIMGRKKPDESGDLHFVPINLLEPTSVKEAFDIISKQCVELHGFVYSAGVSAPRISIEDFDLNEWQNVISVNVTGAMLCLKYCFPILKSTKGRVVFVNSLASRQFSALSGFQYTTSKAALTGLARQLAQEWAPYGILVNSVFPSMTKTPMLEKVLTPEKETVFNKSIPLGRLLKPLEVVNAIEYLLDSRNNYMTGCGLNLNGGQFFN